VVYIACVQKLVI